MSTTFRYSALLLLLVSPAFAQADLVLGLNWSDGASSATARTINNGDTLSVDMFLLDTDGSTNLTDGLGNAGGSLFQTSGTASITPASFSPSPELDATFLGSFGSPNFGHGMFGVPLNGRTGLIAGFALPAALSLGPAGFGLSNIPLGTYALTFNGANGDVGTINTDVFDNSGIFVANETFGGQDLDPILTDFAANPGNFGSLNFAISSAAVPEASTMLVACLLLGTGFVVRRRKRISIERIAAK